MICPKCEAEYVKGITVCVDCGVELVPKEEFESHLVTPSNWVIIYTTQNEIEAEMLKANLEGANIEALVLSQKDQSFPTVGDLAIIKLLVRRKDINVAMEILNDINKSNQENTENQEE